MFIASSRPSLTCTSSPKTERNPTGHNACSVVGEASSRAICVVNNPMFSPKSREISKILASRPASPTLPGTTIDACLPWHDRRSTPTAMPSKRSSTAKQSSFTQSKTASSRDGSKMLNRACQIANATGWKTPEASRLRALFLAVIHDAFKRDDHRGFLNVAEIGLRFRVDEPLYHCSKRRIPDLNQRPGSAYVP